MRQYNRIHKHHARLYQTAPSAGGRQHHNLIPKRRKCLVEWSGCCSLHHIIQRHIAIEHQISKCLTLGLYFGQPGTADVNGFLAKDATIVWKVLDSCTSDDVALVRLYSVIRAEKLGDCAMT